VEDFAQRGLGQHAWAARFEPVIELGHEGSGVFGLLVHRVWSPPHLQALRSTVKSTTANVYPVSS
jgi:hypothetical protein